MSASVTVILKAEAGTGFTTGLELLPVALRGLRSRVLGHGRSLDRDAWEAPSRCERWSVHDVVRHVRDCCRVHVASLNRQPSPFPRAEEFDARRTPPRWLELSAGQSPGETLEDLQVWSAAEDEALGARMAEASDEMVEAPYGTVHWTIFGAHVLWDAWLHARDVGVAREAEPPSTPAEDEVAALYALLIASMPAVFLHHPLDLSLALHGGGGRSYRGWVAPGRAVLETGDAPGGADHEGDLAAVVDALAGRGPELSAVLDGDPARLVPLTWLRSRLAPADG